MKVIGGILLGIGLLSLIGGLISPSNADSGVVVFGYILKFGLIIIGIVLLSKETKKNN